MADLSPKDKLQYEAFGEEAARLLKEVQSDNLPDSISAKELWEYFKAKPARIHFLFRVQHLLAKGIGWDIPSIEEEISAIEQFRSVALNEGIKDDPERHFVSNNQYYKRFIGGHYEQIALPSSAMQFNDPITKVYAESILLYDYLKDRLDEIFKSTPFAVFSAEQQLDEVLLIIKENDRSKGLHYLDEYRLLQKKGYLLPYTILNQIIKRLTDDKKIIVFDYHSILTFDGRVFIGYQKASEISQQAENDEKSYENRAELNQIRLNRLTFYLAIGTIALAAIEFVKLFAELSKEDHLISLTALYLLGSGLALGVVICLLILQLNKEARSRRT